MGEISSSRGETALIWPSL